MTRKDYIATAEILKDNETPSAIALELALMFKRDNPAFRAGKFFDAAGFPELTATRMGLN